jgi:hypothetical protein
MPTVEFDPPPPKFCRYLSNIRLCGPQVPASTLCRVENFLAHAGATLSTTNPTCITLGSGLILQSERLATNPLDHGLTNVHLNSMLEFIPISQTIQSVCITNEKDIV